MKVKDIIKVIEDFAPLSVQEGWDNSGLCVGSPEDEVTSVLLALDCTPALVDEAVACGADMIVTHHPLIFSGLKKISDKIRYVISAKAYRQSGFETVLFKILYLLGKYKI